MTPKEIKTLVEQEAERQVDAPAGWNHSESCAWESGHEAGFKNAITIYEQKILSEVLKEKDEEITKLNTALHEKHLQAREWKNHADNLKAELSQLQSQMEAKDELLKDIVKAWEKLSEGNYSATVIQDWLINNMKPVIDHIRNALNSTNQSPEETK